MTDSDVDLTDPASFEYWITENVRIADTDMGGHINNTALAAYVESGRVSRLRTAMQQRSGGERWVIAHLDMDFRAEGRPPGQVRIGTRLVRMGSKSVTLGAGIFMADRCLATAHSTMVFLNGAETAVIPEAVRQSLAASPEAKPEE
ncbi:MAG: acyl-CoA thioesterase [Alphaproteobacteria bacterium]|jgi:acyl-CoA thioester hydrolase|nr:acyl-CoA thioesterase [Alphaproteobacteria bacterium]MDP6872309.1 acyl-CoA thioesterase [Alphaproteobacteria bacterium]